MEYEIDNELIGNAITGIYQTEPEIFTDRVAGVVSFFNTIITLENGKRYRLGLHKVEPWTSNAPLKLIMYDFQGYDQKLNFKGIKIAQVLRNRAKPLTGTICLLLENNVFIAHQRASSDQLFIGDYETDYYEEIEQEVELVPLTKELLLPYIEAIIYKGVRNQGNFITFSLGSDYYIQLLSSKGDHEMYCEAVGNEFLFPDTFLDETQIARLESLNFTLDDPGGNMAPTGNFAQMHEVDSEESREKLCELIITTAREVYNCTAIDTNQINLEIG